MRIISQNGRMSIDFEDMILERNDNSLYAEIPGLRDRFMLGSFKSKAKVDEIFEEIHLLYTAEYKDISSFRAVYQIPKEM